MSGGPVLFVLLCNKATSSGRCVTTSDLKGQDINTPPNCNMHICCDNRHCISYEYYLGVLLYKSKYLG